MCVLGISEKIPIAKGTVVAVLHVYRFVAVGNNNNNIQYRPVLLLNLEDVLVTVSY